MFQAARYGVRARLPDAQGRLWPVGELLEHRLELLGDHARELGCEAEIERLGALLSGGGGAGRQRTAFEIAGMDGLLREMTELTGGAASPVR
jgi:gamma-glutamyl:cysteine ligase YbdK (ATP-grasp superfamily)